MIKSQLNVPEKGGELELEREKSKSDNDHKLTQPLISPAHDDDNLSLASGRDYEVKISPIDERRSSVRLSKASSQDAAPDLKSWFRKPMFYQYGLAYMGMRVLINVFTVFPLLFSQCFNSILFLF